MIKTRVSTEEAAKPSVHVWLVDDDAELRMLMAQFLDQQDGIQCARHFSSPDELLSMLASKPGPDVILMDVQMGDRNGLDAVRPVRSLTRSTRVLMFSSCNQPSWRRRAFEDGASDYLLKSCAIEDVAERIRSAVKEPVPARHRRRATCSEVTPNSVAAISAQQRPHGMNNILKRVRSFWAVSR